MNYAEETGAYRDTQGRGNGRYAPVTKRHTGPHEPKNLHFGIFQILSHSVLR
jgi:hypothetical protein